MKRALEKNRRKADFFLSVFNEIGSVGKLSNPDEILSEVFDVT